jgi:carboxy-terminal domain RNA polymerase II polypeptide A small phosphatase
MPQVPAAGVVRPPSPKQAPYLNISEALNRGILNP